MFPGSQIALAAGLLLLLILLCLGGVVERPRGHVAQAAPAETAVPRSGRGLRRSGSASSGVNPPMDGSSPAVGSA